MRLGTTAMLALALTFLGIGCRGMNFDQKDVINWMDSKTEAPTIDVSGIWESPSSLWSGGWGGGVWTQQGAQVVGNLGPYTIEGKVSGNRVFAMILSSNRVYYTAIMELTKTGGISGMAVSQYLADAPEARTAERSPIVLVHPAPPPNGTMP